MRTIISFMHISLDGFVAGPKGEMDWIQHEEALFEYIGQRIRKSDTALYGRTTFQMMESYWPKAGEQPKASKHVISHSAWYNRAHKVVLSHTLNESDLINTTVINNNLASRITELKQQPGEEILLFGSPTATHSLMQQNLIDGYWLFVNPIILGEGIPLFLNSKEKTKLILQPTTRQFTCGVTELNYLVDKTYR